MRALLNKPLAEDYSLGEQYDDLPALEAIAKDAYMLSEDFLYVVPIEKQNIIGRGQDINPAHRWMEIIERTGVDNNNERCRLVSAPRLDA